MVQINNGSGRLKTYTYTCSFCDKEYVTDVQTNNAKEHCCGNLPCKQERDRLDKVRGETHRMHKDEMVLPWADRVNAFKPGEVVGEFIGKIVGSRFTANGGVQVNMLVPPEYKRVVMDVTDFSGMLMEVIVKRPPDKRQ